MKAKIIGINTLFLIPNNVGGTENYTRVFLRELEEQDTLNSYIVFCNQENFDTFHFESPRFLKVLCPIFATNRIVRILYEQFVLPFLVLRHHCGVLHSFGYTGPFFTFCKKVVTVHDANWKDHPDDQSIGARLILSSIMEGVIRSADRIVTDSTYSRNRLLYYYKNLESKVKVIHPWVNEELTQQLTKPHQDPLKGKKYWLCVSGLYPHKRIPYLLELIGDQTLVLIGKNGKDEQVVGQMVENLPNVRYFPRVTMDQLIGFYQHARGFLFPSVYEGFGYPVYEACAAGLPTVVGDKNLYETWIQKQLTELSFDLEKDRQKLSKLPASASPLRSPFSAKKSIEDLINLYQSL